MPNYAAKTAAGIERIASFESAAIEMAAAQRDELAALNTRADTTNTRLGSIADSTAPRWVAYATLVAASVAVFVAIAGILFTIWFAQPRAAVPAPTPAPIATPAASPST